MSIEVVEGTTATRRAGRTPSRHGAVDKKVVMTTPPSPELTVMAVSSGGGHWAELLRLGSAFEPCHVVWVTTDEGHGADLGAGDVEFHTVMDASSWSKARVAPLAAQLLWLLLRVRPDVVVTTGAAPGYLALRLGKALGAHTIWVDSIANGYEMSRSGRMVAPWADEWLTQWPDIARPDGPEFHGSVL